MLVFLQCCFCLVQERDISWRNDQTRLYGDYRAQNFNDLPQYRGGGAITQNVSRSEHLLVWMRPSAYHTMRKLWGKINTPLPAGEGVHKTGAGQPLRSTHTTLGTVYCDTYIHVPPTLADSVILQLCLATYLVTSSGQFLDGSVNVQGCLRCK